MMRMIKIVFCMCVMLLLSACQSFTTKSNDSITSESDIDPEVRQQYKYALRLMHSGKDDSAIKLLNHISQENDDLAGPYTNRGLIYLKQNKKEQAKKSFQDAIARNPNNVTALNQLGIMLREQKDFKAARINYEKALAANSNHANSHLNLGVLCDIYLQDKPCAMEHYEAYQALKNDDEVNNWIIDLKERM